MYIQLAAKLKKVIKKILGESGINNFRKYRKLINSFLWKGDKCECCICDSKLKKWKLYGDKSKQNRICPVCHSFGRQRFLWFCIKKKLITLNSETLVLHFAPELCLIGKFHEYCKNKLYITADLYQKEVDLRLDLMDIEKPDDSCGTIICLHVLEHVPEDNKALHEIYRVLKPGGQLILQVPLSGKDQTYEDLSIVSSEERSRVYGQSDHLRLYGYDIKNKLNKVGFNVTVINPCDFSDKHEFDYYGLDLPKSSQSLYESESVIFLSKKTGNDVE